MNFIAPCGASWASMAPLSLAPPLTACPLRVGGVFETTTVPFIVDVVGVRASSLQKETLRPVGTLPEPSWPRSHVTPSLSSLLLLCSARSGPPRPSM